MIMANPWIHGLVIGVAVLGFMMTLGGLGVWFERRFAGWLQLRVGPAWVGPFGLLQLIADAIKTFQKEDLIPAAADRTLFNLAPILPVFLVLALAVIIPTTATVAPDGSWVAAYPVAHLDVGVLWPLAMGGLMVFPIWAAGWASGNKYSLLSGMRMVAQGISYEIPMVLSALVPVLLAGSLSVSDIVTWQMNHYWIIFFPPGTVAFVIYFLTSLAEANRIPFDVPEAESELVGGITIEYSGIKMLLFVLAEYVHTAVASVLAATLFLGGPHMLFSVGPPWLGFVWLAAKSTFLFVVIYWIRWSLLRFRADQLMDFAWRWLVPVTLALVMLSAVWVQLMEAA